MQIGHQRAVISSNVEDGELLMIVGRRGGDFTHQPCVLCVCVCVEGLPPATVFIFFQGQLVPGWFPPPTDPVFLGPKLGGGVGKMQEKSKWGEEVKRVVVFLTNTLLNFQQ